MRRVRDLHGPQEDVVGKVRKNVDSDENDGGYGGDGDEVCDEAGGRGR